jgi:dihydropteroate synthase
MLFPPDRVTLVGVLNATPDSFSDGGRFADVAAAAAWGRELVRQGAHVLDVGGESTRPGAEPVPAEVEIGRVVPLIRRLAQELGLPISVDTRKARVADAALAAGACAVNDVSGGRFDPELLAVAARHGADLVLGHLRGEPATMQRDVRFDDVLEEVAEELAAAVERAREAGVARERIAVDPGIGFGKCREHNLALLANVGVLRERLGRPVLVGPSRKSFLGELTGEPRPAARDLASHVACAVAVFAGADAVRVHDVAGAASAVAVARALRGARRKAA